MFLEEKYIFHVQRNIFAVVELVKAKTKEFSLSFPARHEYFTNSHNVSRLRESEESGDDGQSEQCDGHRVELEPNPKAPVSVTRRT